MTELRRKIMWILKHSCDAQLSQNANSPCRPHRNFFCWEEACDVGNTSCQWGILRAFIVLMADYNKSVKLSNVQVRISETFYSSQKDYCWCLITTNESSFSMCSHLQPAKLGAIEGRWAAEYISDHSRSQPPLSIRQEHCINHGICQTNNAPVPEKENP
ncbi:hypothetical protein RRG08_055209 [Elysia crispata]|uniref:Uncharacterized protein n=1 Tax=Elysia crispata TaxID=231223 RepID=A0AAE1CM14_9GAST|nr:hypothetical protein RRG08_055209 [Elysia crispata]